MTSSGGQPPPASRAHRVSLEAVAREADVSLSTASRALSGGSVRPQLRDRVLAAVQRLGYTPDLAAQAVARGSTRTVALIVDYLRSSFGVEITRGVVDAAARHGLVVSVTGTETHPGDLLEMIASARALRPQALVLATGRVQDLDIRDDLVRDLNAYQASGGRVAIVDGLDLPFASCAFDEDTAADALAEQLVDMGYRRPLVFNSSAERADLAGRTTRLLSAFESAGIPRGEIAQLDLTTEESGSRPHQDLLELGDADVVLCVEGAVLPAVYRHIRSRGLQVGADVAVTAFGQYGIADALRPHLTTVQLPLRRAGELALEHALADTDGEHLSLPCDLRVRASTPWRARSARVPPAVSEDRGGSRIVGVVLPDLPADDLGTVTRELLDRADEDGLSCVFLSEQALQSGAVPEHGMLDAFASLLVWGSISAELADALDRSGIPCVAVGRPNSDRIGQVSIEIAEGMQALLEHLFGLGHERILYLAGEESSFETQRRWGVELFRATHDSVTVELIEGADDATIRSVVDSARRIGVTAVIGHDDLTAVRAVRALAADGVRVPDEVSVAGFGGSPLELLCEPALTTVEVDVAALARAAWRLLSVQVAAGELHSRGTSLIVRASTGPVAV